MTDLIAIPQKHSDVLVDAWCSHNRQLAERFSQALRKARAEVGPGDNYSAIVRRAWASDPNLRAEFGDAISSGLRRMWASADARSAQSERIRQSYTQSLRKQRSEELKKNWADSTFRERMMRARGRAGEQSKQNGRAA
jgi:hypothetical protein